MKRAYAEVNLSRLKQNILDIRKKLSPNTKFMAVVKADGYGHGAVEVSKSALEVGVDYLGVAWIGEARQIRLAGITAPILLLSEPAIETVAEIISLKITPTVYTELFVEALATAANANNQQVSAHIKVDTGMGRVGVQPEKALALALKIKSLPELNLEGLFTHFACADDPDNPFTYVQLARFNKVIKQFAENNITIPITHSANSAATRNFPETHGGMVRIGLTMFNEVLSFKSRVAFVKDVPEGFSISYGATYKTSKPTRIATISVGYADGYSRHLSNRGTVLINGERYPIVGLVCMDMLMVDIGDDLVAMGDEVILIGEQVEEKITVAEIAKLSEVIEYEVLCGIGKRVPRIYTEKQK